ncbi:polyphosphate kinase 2 [Klugiella xanthotipulae]|uniref:ADP/GDP-polyphosphate phosphotransferase n=2 Tax=Klugiella xanthotipulae TaxID=244735 RepID=A0A543I598_9MICO|nr:polyphosphate kinase 2 [Klugiella xanthotipulae]
MERHHPKKARTMTQVKRMPKKRYETELRRLQTELVALQQWVRATHSRVVIIFEGRDAAGKGSAIKRVSEYLNPRYARIVALPAPSQRDQSRWYYQRYVAHLPSAGEIVLMDRSWYNRAGVERVMGFCTDEQYERFMDQTPTFEQMLLDDGIILLKYWFSVSDMEQERRFRSRRDDPMRQWKLSDMDVQSISRWEDYSKAKDVMFDRTSTEASPWWTVESDDKRSSRINVMAHILSQIPYSHVPLPAVEIPPRPAPGGYERPPLHSQRYVPDYAATLTKK